MCPKKKRDCSPDLKKPILHPCFSTSYGKVPIGSNLLFSPHPTVLITHTPPILCNQTASSHLSHLHENKPNFINPEDGGSTFLLMFMSAYTV